MRGRRFAADRTHACTPPRRLTTRLSMLRRLQVTRDVGVFIGVLGVWGLLSVETFETRAREHRFRIRKIVAELKGEGRPVEEKVHLLNWVWRTFHVLIALLGVLLVYWYFCEPTWLPRSAG